MIADNLLKIEQDIQDSCALVHRNPKEVTLVAVTKSVDSDKAEELIIEYNEELRIWKKQTEQKKEKPLEQPKKASVLEKLHRYQQEGRQQPKRLVKRKSMDRER